MLLWYGTILIFSHLLFSYSPVEQIIFPDSVFLFLSFIALQSIWSPARVQWRLQQLKQISEVLEKAAMQRAALDCFTVFELKNGKKRGEESSSRWANGLSSCLSLSSSHAAPSY